ncbi:Lrp/AsnC family transcriptional regulator [Kribbella sp. NPDC051718]|uniref:Lrp/AsnC family transcriptional regulator n=1 Tax=Kribbella sp. NPDC051718 TaxID=3155168 RepID=UPI003445C99F
MRRPPSNSTQTIARRYRRLVADAGLRVVGLADPRRAGQAQWLARLTATPQAAQDLARALAKREDTSWVRLASGGTEISAIIQTTPGDGNALLLHDISRTTGITAVSAHYLLHMYRGGPTAWRAHLKALTPAQQHQLIFDEMQGGTASVGTPDQRLLAVLGQDGRAGFAELAVATGWSAATVAKRLGELRASGAIYFDVDLDPALFGVTTGALLWMSVVPAHLDRVGKALAEHDELAFVAATTGRTNLAAHALSPDPDSLHHYLTHRLAAFPEITSLESAPVLRTIKSAAPFTPSTQRPDRPRVS